MALIRDPVLFSQHFNVKPEKLSNLGLFDPTLNCDTKLFIDPLLLKQSRHPLISVDAVKAFDAYFANIIRVLQHSAHEGDLPWRSADKLFTFKEPKETCLGYGERTTHGSAIGPGLRSQIMNTAKAIIKLGVKDPELFALMGLLEAGIGPDRISDMTTFAIKSTLCKFNEEVLSKLGLPTEKFAIGDDTYHLVANPFELEGRSPVILVPNDLLRPLPVVTDWSDVAHAASLNDDLRARVNQRIGNIWELRTKQDKADARAAVLRSKAALDALMETVGAADKSPYDEVRDLEGHYLWRKVHSEIAAQHPVHIQALKNHTTAELERVVDDIITTFADAVENKGQWYHLWHGTECRHERAAQRLFFAIADAYCKANNLAVSPETDSGAGPVDFKFSAGYNANVLVELKLSTGKVVHGYKTQLEAYKSAVGSSKARYVVIDVGKMGKKFDIITKYRNTAAQAGDPVTPIVRVDGKRKQSASKR